MIVEKVKWLCYVDNHPVGIVKVYDDIERRHKYYIGTGRGRSEAEDIRLIMSWGQKYYDLDFFEGFLGGKKMNTEIFFSSKTNLWETPQKLFDKYDKIYHFETDVCALPENAKCKNFFTPEMDGLKQEWKDTCWCNPPYGRNIGKWIEKAAKSSSAVVMLLPARTDTKWFHDYCLPYGKIEFIKGRLKFGNSKNSAPFPSMIVVFNDDIHDNPELLKGE